VSAVLAQPIVRLLYQRGEFGPTSTDIVAAALAAFSLGLVFNGMMLMLNRGFFSLQAPWTPTLVALGNLGISTALFAVLYRVGTWGIPLAISVANIFGTAALLVLMRRRIGRIDFSRTARTVLLVTVASAALAVVAFAVWYGLDRALGRSLAAQITSVTLALVAGAAAYLGACRVLGVREIDALLSLWTRFKRA
jgi:putative peptidoglycan lipid II flippase